VTKVLLSVAVVFMVMVAGGLSSQGGRVVQTTTETLPAAEPDLDLPALHLPNAEESPRATEDDPTGDADLFEDDRGAPVATDGGIATHRSPQSATGDGSSTQFSVTDASQPTVCKGSSDSDASSSNGRRLRERDSDTRCKATRPHDDCTEGDCEEDED
jgi:hypothetical protein